MSQPDGLYLVSGIDARLILSSWKMGQLDKMSFPAGRLFAAMYGIADNSGRVRLSGPPPTELAPYVEELIELGLIAEEFEGCYSLANYMEEVDAIARFESGNAGLN